MLEYWYQAIQSPHGIEITVSDQNKAKALLYAARKEAHDALLETISIRVPPNKPDKLWLVHNGRKESPLPTAEGNPQAI